MTSVSILPANVDLIIVRGTDNTFEFILTDGDGKPINLSNDSTKLTTRDKLGGAIVVPTKTNTSSQHIDPANGKTQFTFDKTEIDDEASATERTFWVYEIRRIKGTTLEENVHLAGCLIIQPTPEPE